MPDVPELIRLLNLEPHPLEGGYYRETYRSDAPGTGGSARRAVATAIYYLLTPDTRSAPHRLPADELFHFYLGDPVEMLQLYPDGTSAVLMIGTDLAAGMRPQVLVPAGVWQGSRLAPGGRFALLGTTMAPGFDPAGYEAGDIEALGAAYPEHRERILDLGRRP